MVRNGRSLFVVAAAALMALVAACGPMPDPPTTTTSSTTTSSTTTSTVSPGCEDYTPTSIGLTNSTVTPFDTVLASGNGSPGTTVEITFFRPSTSEVVDPGVSTVVNGGGNYSTPLEIPELALGAWQVRANVVGCGLFATTNITVV